MAEDIIITPGSGQIDFQDTGNTSTILVVSSGALKWNRSGTTYLEWNPSSPTFRVGPADLRLTTKIVNNAERNSKHDSNNKFYQKSSLKTYFLFNMSVFPNDIRWLRSLLKFYIFAQKFTKTCRNNAFFNLLIYRISSTIAFLRFKSCKT